MKICINCALPETFPGLRFNEEGVCNFCLDYQAQKERIYLQKEAYRYKFLRLLDQLRDLDKQNKPDIPERPDGRNRLFSYDVLIAYSGGKDSSFTLKTLKEDYGLRILAMTFDNGFLSTYAMNNIKRVCKSLEIDHLLASPNPHILNKTFRESAFSEIYPPRALLRASSICHTCMHLVKSYVLKTAIEMGIPLMAYGWSPGQAPITSAIMKWNVEMIKQFQSSLGNTLKNIMGSSLHGFVLSDRHFKLLSLEKNLFLYNVHPLAFLDYNEKEILQTVKELGWEEPSDTDSNSTNCLLNSLGIKIHQDRFGFHPYALEIAALVRAGYMTREEGLAKLLKEPDHMVVEEVKKKLAIT